MVDFFGEDFGFFDEELLFADVAGFDGDAFPGVEEIGEGIADAAAAAAEGVLDGGGILRAVEKLAEGGLGVLEDFLGGFETGGGGQLAHHALVEERVAVLAEAHGFDAHALGGNAGVDLAAVADFHALLGVVAIVDVGEILANDLEAFRVNLQRSAAVVKGGDETSHKILNFRVWGPFPRRGACQATAAVYRSVVIWVLICPWAP